MLASYFLLSHFGVFIVVVTIANCRLNNFVYHKLLKRRGREGHCHP